MSGTVREFAGKKAPLKRHIGQGISRNSEFVRYQGTLTFTQALEPSRAELLDREVAHTSISDGHPCYPALASDNVANSAYFRARNVLRGA
jgi:hypothetical protein